MYDKMQEIISEQSKKIQVEMHRLVLEKVKEKTGLDLDVEMESQKRFPRIKIESNPSDQSTTYYWNDGSKHGIRLITFYQDLRMPDWTHNSDDFKMSITMKYR